MPRWIQDVLVSGPSLDKFIYDYVLRVWLVNNGQRARVAECLGKSPRWVYDYVKKHPQLVSELEEKRDREATLANFTDDVTLEGYNVDF